jgi:hypothetical protein
MQVFSRNVQKLFMYSNDNYEHIEEERNLSYFQYFKADYLTGKRP